MTTTQHPPTFNKSQRERIFRSYMKVATRYGYETAIYELAAEHDCECEDIIAVLNRTVVGR